MVGGVGGVRISQKTMEKRGVGDTKKTWLEHLNSQEVLKNSSCNHFVEAGSVIRYPA